MSYPLSGETTKEGSGASPEDLRLTNLSPLHIGSTFFEVGPPSLVFVFFWTSTGHPTIFGGSLKRTETHPHLIFRLPHPGGKIEEAHQQNTPENMTWKSRPLAEFPFGATIKIKKDPGFAGPWKTNRKHLGPLDRRKNRPRMSFPVTRKETS